MPDLVVANGMVVLPQGPQQADVVIDGETIIDIVEPGTGRADLVEDAGGRIVLPGGVDPHVHFLIAFMGQRSVYDFGNGGIAALRGGTTTVVDFALQRPGKSMLAGLAHRRKQADPVVTLDYGLHQIITDVNDETLKELPELRRRGVSSLKIYMVYEDDGLRLDDGALWRLMEAATPHEMLFCFHAENFDIIDRLKNEALSAGRTAPIEHARTRPPITELEAISRVLLFGGHTSNAVHILHLAAADGIAMVEAARQAGHKATAETCTHFLALTEDKLSGPDPQNFVLSPPLRNAENQDRLWVGLRSGAISAVTSDEVSYSADAKRMGLASFDQIANGCPGVEARLPVTFTLGVDQGRLSLTQFAERFADWPALIFGLAGQKGRIAPGYDADLVVIDPQTRKTITAADHYGDIGYTPYEGMALTGWPVMTVYRGRVVVRDRAFLGTLGQGRFLHRGTTQTPGMA